MGEGVMSSREVDDKTDKAGFVVSITEGLCVTQRGGDTLAFALASAMMAQTDLTDGGLSGVFLDLARTMRDVFNSDDWDDDSGEDAKLGNALWEFLKAKGEPGFGG
jgi:hypothetical protein